tara:strand:+ start:263 stop:487 length:225 start_codon:yes stop_codon:yes gene_type:complete
MVEAKKYSEGMDRGYLAYLLEKRGLQEQAEEEWKVAANLSGHADVERIKNLTHKIVESQDLEILIQAEKAVLDY